MTTTQKNSAVSFFQNRALLTNLSHQLQNLFTFTENYPKRGFSPGLSVQYLIEQRQQGSSGGQGYLSWLKLLTDSIHTRFLSIKPGITSTADTENLLRHQFRLLRLSEALLNLHPDGITLNRIPVLPFQKNGLIMETPTGKEASFLKHSVKKNYVDFMESLRDPTENQYFLFFTTADIMAVTYQKTENGSFWSFFDPDEGAYLYDNYENFKNDTDEYFFNTPDSGHGFYDSQTKGRASIKYARLSEAGTLSYDETWKHFNQKESLYVIDELIERKIRLPFNKYTSARLLDRTLSAEGHVVSIRVQLMNHPSSDEIKMIEVNSPFSSLKDLHAAFLDPLNPFGGDFKSAPESEPGSDKPLENESGIFFDLQGEPYFEMESYEKELMLPKIREIYNQRLSLNEIDFPNLPFLTQKNRYLLLQLRWFYVNGITL